MHLLEHEQTGLPGKEQRIVLPSTDNKRTHRTTHPHHKIRTPKPKQPSTYCRIRDPISCEIRVLSPQNSRPILFRPGAFFLEPPPPTAALLCAQSPCGGHTMPDRMKYKSSSGAGWKPSWWQPLFRLLGCDHTLARTVAHPTKAGSGRRLPGERSRLAGEGSSIAELRRRG